MDGAYLKQRSSVATMANPSSTPLIILDAVMQRLLRSLFAFSFRVRWLSDDPSVAIYGFLD